MPRIFISYKRADKDKVFAIKDKIEAATGEKCWIDLDGIESDAQFEHIIINAINQAEIFLFMYSHQHTLINDVDNDWTIKEINFAQLKKKRIVFINIDRSPLTDWFIWKFGSKQQNDAMSAENLSHLMADINKWLGYELKKRTIQEQNIEGESIKNQVEYIISNPIKEQDTRRFTFLKRTKQIIVILFLGAFNSKYIPQTNREVHLSKSARGEWGLLLVLLAYPISIATIGFWGFGAVNLLAHPIQWLAGIITLLITGIDIYILILYFKFLDILSNLDENTYNITEDIIEITRKMIIMPIWLMALEIIDIPIVAFFTYDGEGLDGEGKWILLLAAVLPIIGLLCFYFGVITAYKGSKTMFKDEFINIFRK